MVRTAWVRLSYHEELYGAGSLLPFVLSAVNAPISAPMVLSEKSEM